MKRFGWAASSLLWNNNWNRSENSFTLFVHLRRNTNKSAAASTSNEQFCWKCNKLVDDRTKFCVFCSVIQPVTSKEDFFSYLGFERRFPLDEIELKNRFWKLQSLVHPDKYSRRDEREQQLSEVHSSFLNNAYKTLQDPYARASYLLKMLTNFKETPLDNEIAVKMMELNESIEELDDENALEKKLLEVQKELDRLLLRLEEQFLNSKLDEVKRTLDRIRFFTRARTFINKKLGRDYN